MVGHGCFQDSVLPVMEAGQMDLVQRDEFEAVKEMAMKARLENEELRAEIEALKAAQAKPAAAKPATKKPAAKKAAPKKAAAKGA